MKEFINPFQNVISISEKCVFHVNWLLRKPKEKSQISKPIATVDRFSIKSLHC